MTVGGCCAYRDGTVVPRGGDPPHPEETTMATVVLSRSLDVLDKRFLDLSGGEITSVSEDEVRLSYDSDEYDIFRGSFEPRGGRRFPGGTIAEIVYVRGGTTVLTVSGLNEDAATIARFYKRNEGRELIEHILRDDDDITGSSGHDRLLSFTGDDVLRPGAGNDTVDGGKGFDEVIIDGAAEDFAVSRRGKQIAVQDQEDGDGDAGRDLLKGIGKISFDNAIIIFGRKAGEGFEGTAGHDTLLGNDGADTLAGDDGDDLLIGGSGNDQLDGGEGDDEMSGGAGNDTLEGGSGDDLLDGGRGDDVLEGGDGSDRLVADGGTDTLAGGEGDDVYFVFGGSATIIEQAGEDGGVDGVVTLISLQLPDNLEDVRLEESGHVTGNGLDNFIVGSAGRDTLDGGGGNDTIVSGPGRDKLAGGDGDDVLAGFTGRDTLTGGAGADRFFFALEDRSAGRSRDIISDFAPGIDQIDLSQFGFTYIGDAAFSGANQLRYDAAKGQLRGTDDDGELFFAVSLDIGTADPDDLDGDLILV
jgi:Ca2+-binding RTX toxin-like protein